MYFYMDGIFSWVKDGTICRSWILFLYLYKL